MNEVMSRHTSFRIGGPADLYVVCDSLEQLTDAVRVLEEEEVDWTVIGKGTNLLVADSGYRGAVILLGNDFRKHRAEGERLHSGAAASLAALVQTAFREGLSGLAFGVGIPGTVGGALEMNAGAHGGWIGEAVESVTVFVPGSGLSQIRGRDVQWRYRGSGLSARGIIVEGVLRVEPGEPAKIRAEMERNFESRKATQPVGRPSAGSVFRNPEEHHAARLIESAGLKGVRIGQARVSGVHSNFIVNEGGAKASDVVALIRKIQMTVGDMYGIELKPEIRFLGSFEE